MKSKLSKILKDLRAQREAIHGRRFTNQSTLLDLMPNATLLTPEERVSINEFLGATSNEPIGCEKKKGTLFFSFAEDPDDTKRGVTES